MPQEEIIEVLERLRKPMSRTEIAEILQINREIASKLIARLVKTEEVKCIEINRQQAMKVYHCKRRMRLYYL